MLETSHTTTVTPLSPAVESLERIRLTAKMAHQDWFDILDLQWKDYQEIKLGKASTPEKVLERVSSYFGIPFEDLVSGDVDFKQFSMAIEDQDCAIPEKYMKGAFGRRRTSITSVDFLEERFGWRLRLDALQNLGVSETGLNDAFAPISINFISDLCSYLAKRQFRGQDFFAMGANAYSGNKNTIVAKLFAETETPADLFEFFCSEAIRLFEQNCTYKIKRRSDTTMTIDILSNPHVSAELGIRHLGNCHVCDVKRGLISRLPLYIGLPPASIIESACVHRGDSACRFEIDFSEAERVRLKQPSE